MTLKEAAQEALDVQNACNLSGVLRSFHEIVSGPIRDEARKQGKGIEFVNTHPIVTLFLSKLCDLNRTSEDLGTYVIASRAVEAIAQGQEVAQ